MNVLLSCSGKQVNLVKWFKASLDENSIVIASDSNKFAPSLASADKYLIAPSIFSPEYREWVIDACKQNNVSLLLSLYEEDLIILESLRKDLLLINCILIGADPFFIQGITNKWTAKALIEQAGLMYPPTYLLSNFVGNEFEGPYIVKPCLGRGSRGIHRAETAEQVKAIAKSLDKPSEYIVQKLLSGNTYCLDIVNDLHGVYQCTLIRRRIQMGPEETEIAVTTENSSIEKLAGRLSSISKHQGSVDVDLIENRDGLFIIDVNMRFGGSYAFSHAAGANIPGAIVCWASGRQPPCSFLSHEIDVVGAKFNSVQRVDA